MSFDLQCCSLQLIRNVYQVRSHIILVLTWLVITQLTGRSPDSRSRVSPTEAICGLNQGSFYNCATTKQRRQYQVLWMEAKTANSVADWRSTLGLPRKPRQEVLKKVWNIRNNLEKLNKSKLFNNSCFIHWPVKWTMIY